jgi:2-succinyl-5-enolpyruvyl-6-hydroxy-3-cyclohexene-1-carboxylate synthase
MPHEARGAQERGLSQVHTEVRLQTQAQKQSQGQACVALFLSAFFDELIGLGVKQVVISPGSRSTPLAMVVSKSALEVFVNIDERSAGFFALGLAKASGHPTCLICTSGSAVANFYPAVLEAESARVALIVLSADRPPHLQGVGAPQTCDQINIFGNHVRHFQQMPLGTGDEKSIAFVRHIALVGFAKAAGAHAVHQNRGFARQDQALSDSSTAKGPVHFNFPFDEPLTVDLGAAELFSIGKDRQNTPAKSKKSLSENLPVLIKPKAHLEKEYASEILRTIAEKRTVVLCAEGTFSSAEDAQLLLEWADMFGLPLLADPLSNLRSFNHPLVIDSYDTIFAEPHCSSEDYPPFDLVIRFGRYPVSKRCNTLIDKTRPEQIVVDAEDTRDFHAMTNIFVRMTPVEFVSSLMYQALEENKTLTSVKTRAYTEEWILANDKAGANRAAELSKGAQVEGSYIEELIKCVPAKSCLFSANSLSIRLLDRFYAKSNKEIFVLCNRGLSGIDGTLSTALGAAQHFEQTTLLIGDLAMLHDIGALAQHAEMLTYHSEQSAQSLVVVILNNHGGAIFDLLPQKSEDPSFERLFITPQKVDFGKIASGFGVSHTLVNSVSEMSRAYKSVCGTAGISIIEVELTIDGLSKRFAL